MEKHAVFLFGHGVEELELIAPADLLRRAGWRVTFLSCEEALEVLTKGGFAIRADAFLDSWLGTADLLVLPGGPGVMSLRGRADVKAFIQSFAKARLPIAAICAAPLLLAEAGLLDGKRFTCHFSCWDALPSAIQEEKVVIDGNIITSQGAGTAIEFGLALIDCFGSKSQRKEIEKAVMFN